MNPVAPCLLSLVRDLLYGSHRPNEAHIICRILTLKHSAFSPWFVVRPRLDQTMLFCCRYYPRVQVIIRAARTMLPRCSSLLFVCTDASNLSLPIDFTSAHGVRGVKNTFNTTCVVDDLYSRDSCVVPRPSRVPLCRSSRIVLSKPGKDVHAGNLLVLEDGRVGFIDFGIVGRIPQSVWSSLRDLR